MKMTLRRTVAALSILVLAGVAPLGVACGGDDDGDGDPTATAPAGTQTGGPGETPGETPGGPTATDTGQSTTMTVSLTNAPFAVTLSQDTAPAGEFEIAVTNDGNVGHQFIIVKTDIAPGDLPVEDSVAVLDDVEIITNSNLITDGEPLTPGQILDVSTTLEAGSYVLLCNVADHYSAGMNVGLTVE